MGDGAQTCRRLVDDGAIGKPIGFCAFFLTCGRENWHLDPEFFFKKGGGPIFDMGPYYLTILVNLLGPVKTVAAFTKITYPKRVIGSKPRRGQVITVDTPTHVAATISFANGAAGTMLMSFDVHGGDIPFMEVYGTEGTLSVPDPNGFGGPIRVLRRKGKRKTEWREMKLMRGLAVQGRSVGLADMAAALRGGPPHRASGKLAYHVLDVMDAFLDSGRQKKLIRITSTCERPAPIPLTRPRTKKAKAK
jgi:predicted dehydrogenase